ncbi:uncharacterized protein [Pempheris klunzingeri]|uniref:uncharacterized protein n=1 Tax=Pempheris klunzingeri TaxID=3127111 RepID=UPI00397F3DA4
MTTSAAKLQGIYNQQGFLSALPVVNETELREANQAFSQLEKEFGEQYTQYSLHNVHLQYPWVRSLTQHQQILRVVKAILDNKSVIHDGLLVHASDANTSQRRRYGFVIRYVPTRACPIQDPDRPRKFDATMLVCGTDHLNHFSRKNNNN